MAALVLQPSHHLSRLTTAARLARMRPQEPVEVVTHGSWQLATARLVLRPLRPTDRDAYLEAVRSSRTDLDAFCPMHRAGESDAELFERQLQLSRAADATGRALRCIAIDRARAGRMLGAFNFNDITHGLEPRAEVNFWIRSDATGCGIAREALHALLAHAFAPRCPLQAAAMGVPPGLGLSRVEGLISPENAASLNLVRRLGFVPDSARLPRRLDVLGRHVEHLPFVRFAQVALHGVLHPRVPAGVSLGRSIDALLSIEHRAAEGL